jgi:hypothetical protein
MPDQFNLEQHTAAIHALAGDKRVVDSPVAVLKIGEALQVVRNSLGPSEFQTWLSEEFDWGQPCASNWMRAAAQFGHLVDDPCLPMFGHTAMYELARGTVPAGARDEAVIAARDGLEITLPVAREIIRRHLGIGAPVNQLSRGRQMVAVAVAQIRPGLDNLSRWERRQMCRDLVGLKQDIQPLIDFLSGVDGIGDESPDDDLSNQDIPTTLDSKPDAKLRGLSPIRA